MDGFEWNKVLMGLILALLVGKVSGKISDILIAPDINVKNAYVMAEVKETSTNNKIEDVLEPIEPLLASADLEAGQKVARKCLQCHSFENEGKNKVGPNLWNVVNAPYGHVDGFSYSAVIKEAKSQGKKWDYESLNGFLEKPKKYLKGTKMAFVGLKKARDRANLIAYLRSLSNSPAPLPN
tara:strand:+ start:240 stop:782 length:543 start_codon:yes stop_codon:yes gene_type:complete